MGPKILFAFVVAAGLIACSREPEPNPPLPVKECIRGEMKYAGRSSWYECYEWQIKCPKPLTLDSEQNHTLVCRLKKAEQ